MCMRYVSVAKIDGEYLVAMENCDNFDNNAYVS